MKKLSNINKKYYVIGIILLVIVVCIVLCSIFLNKSEDEPKIENGPKYNEIKDNIEVKDNILNNGKIILLEVKNKNVLSLETTFTIEFYDESDNFIESKEYLIDVLPANKISYLEVYTGDLFKNYKSYKYKIETKEIKDLKIYDESKVEVNHKIVDDMLNIKILNNSDEEIGAVLINIIFYKNNKMIKYTKHEVIGVNKDVPIEFDLNVSLDYSNKAFKYDRYELKYLPYTKSDGYK